MELYRSGVFSHTTKESIATLGIGSELDALETEFTDEDKAGFAVAASSELFPGALALIQSASLRALEIARVSQETAEEVRSVRIERPDANDSAVQHAVTSARENFRTELRELLQSDVNRFCSGLNVTVANLIVQAKTRCDSDLTLLRKARVRRYTGAFAITAVIFLCFSVGYRHWGHPPPVSLLGEAVLNVVCGLLVEALVLLILRARENAPKLLARTRETVQVKLKDEVKQAVDSQLSALVLHSLNEQVISSGVSKIYEPSLDLPSTAWQSNAKEALELLRALSGKYVSHRASYERLVEQVRSETLQYFSDSSRNLNPY